MFLRKFHLALNCHFRHNHIISDKVAKLWHQKAMITLGVSLHAAIDRELGLLKPRRKTPGILIFRIQGTKDDLVTG